MEDYKQTLYNDELLNILPDGVIIFDTNGEVIQLNQQALAELHVHPSVNEMLPFPTDHLFKLINKGEDILPIILEKIHQGENTYSIIIYKKVLLFCTNQLICSTLYLFRFFFAREVNDSGSIHRNRHV